MKIVNVKVNDKVNVKMHETTMNTKYDVMKKNSHFDRN